MGGAGSYSALVWGGSNRGAEIIQDGKSLNFQN